MAPPQTATATRVAVNLPVSPNLPLTTQEGTNSLAPAPAASQTPSIQVIDRFANLTMANIQTQNDALQANNQANSQILQTLERNQNTTQMMTQEIARLNADIVSLRNQLATNAQAHQTQIETLTTQLGALQQLVARLEYTLTSLQGVYNNHVHIIDRGHHVIEVGYGPRKIPTPVNDYPIKITEGPRDKNNLYDHPDGCIVQ